MILEKLFNKYNTDKSEKHGYHMVYEKYFEPYKSQKIKILEVGVWEGASTLALHEYFDSAEIYGVDIFERFPMESIRPYSLERCQFIQGDSMRKNIVEKVQEEWGDIRFDIIIDDGKHTPRANMKTFENFSQFLSDDGQYFIEDVWPLEKMTMAELDHYWLQKKPHEYNTTINNEFLTTLENSDMKIEKFDLRKKSGEPDSYIIRLSK